MLSELLPRANPRIGRSSFSYSQRYGGRPGQRRTCTRCGTLHGEVDQCPAKYRKCYSCRRYGHYADLCTSGDSSGQQDYPSTHEHSDTESEDSFCSVDSVNYITKAADLEDKCAKFQDDNVSLQRELTDLRDKNTHLTVQITNIQDETVAVQKECADLRARNADLTEQVNRCQNDTASLRKQNTQSQTQNEDLTLQLSKCQQETASLKRRRDDLKTQNKKLSQQISQLKHENLVQNTASVDLKAKTKDLSGQINQIKHSLREEERKSQLLDEQLEQMVRFCGDIDDCRFELVNLCNDLIAEYANVACRINASSFNLLCNRCGTKSHPNAETCPANGWNFNRCGKVNHYAAVCKSSGLPIVEDYDEFKPLLQTLECKYGICVERCGCSDCG